MVKDGQHTFSVLTPTETILEARDMIMRVGRENCAADSSLDTITRTGRDWCHPSVWHLATARPLEPCPNAGCGGPHILADCQYETMCSGCGKIGHLHTTCDKKCPICWKRHSEHLCPKRRGGPQTLRPQLKTQGGQQGR